MPFQVTAQPQIIVPNPFARKPQDTKSNSFSRSSTSKANLVTRNNSFFDKVDEVNDMATRAKPCGYLPQPRTIYLTYICLATKAFGKEGQKTQQTTLFGALSGPGPERKGSGRPHKATVASQDNQTEETLSERTLDTAVSQGGLMNTSQKCHCLCIMAN